MTQKMMKWIRMIQRQMEAKSQIRTKSFIHRDKQLNRAHFSMSYTLFHYIFTNGISWWLLFLYLFMIRCDKCKLHFLSFIRLDRHCKLTHDAKEFKCADLKCVDSFETQQLADDHYAERHKRKECPVCKKMIMETALADHIRTRHDPSTSVICEVCGKVSKDRLKHSTHLKQAHDPRGSLQCDICKKW